MCYLRCLCRFRAHSFCIARRVLLLDGERRGKRRAGLVYGAKRTAPVSAMCESNSSRCMLIAPLFPMLYLATIYNRYTYVSWTLQPQIVSCQSDSTREQSEELAARSAADGATLHVLHVGLGVFSHINCHVQPDVPEFIRSIGRTPMCGCELRAKAAPIYCRLMRFV